MIQAKKTPSKSSIKVAGKSGAKLSSKTSAKSEETIQSWLQLGQLRFEKCELKESQVAFSMALQTAKRAGDLRLTMEALAGLLRVSSESLDEISTQKLDQNLEELMQKYPSEIPPMAWYCKAVVARHRKHPQIAQKNIHLYLQSLEKEKSKKSGSATATGLSIEEAAAKGWTLLSAIFLQKGKYRRAQWLAETLLSQVGSSQFRGINGILYMVIATCHERYRNHEQALSWYQKSHASFLAEHNWYYHLYVLLAYARVYRMQQNYPQAYWHVDLVDKAAPGAEFGLLRREIAIEKVKLEQDAVDLTIDSRKGVIKTRESGQISLRKQYVLLHILEALSKAHSKPGEDMERGLSKSEIIQHVWNEPYRPEAHDNKLYYNINRLRKLIEPDVRKPQYLLNWKEGYRLAPGLRVQYLGGQKNLAQPGSADDDLGES
jgi:DNA-binding winged helix-turn-helix (wHTH) protein